MGVQPRVIFSYSHYLHIHVLTYLHKFISRSIDKRIKENRFFLKTSPGNGKAKIETKSCYLTASQSINPHLYVRSGESRFHYSGANGEFVARYGGHSAGFDSNGAFRIF